NGSRIAPAGPDHWSWGLRKETHPVMAAHSARMKAHNPMHMPGVTARAEKTKHGTGYYERVSERMRGSTVSKEIRQKIAKTVAPQLLQRLSQREQVMQAALVFDSRWISQYQVD